MNDSIDVRIEGTDRKVSIPWLFYAVDYSEPFENDRDIKIAEQTIEFAKSLGLREEDYMLSGTESEVEKVRKAILASNAEEKKLFETYDQEAQE